MKKNQTKSQFKEMKGKVKAVSSNVIRIREQGHEGKMPNRHATIEEAFASSIRDYRKA